MKDPARQSPPIESETELPNEQPQGVPADAGPAGDSQDDDGDARDSTAFAVDLPQYAGPLDLLLDLIRKQKINLYDIPIHRITEQYLDYLRRAEELNVDLGGEFVFMAATLIHVKSKMLLPKDPSATEEEQEDPREELVRQLLDHEKFVHAAQMLREKRLVEESIWSNPQIASFQEEDEDPGLAVDLIDLVKTFETVLERFKSRPTYEIEAEEVSVGSRIEFLKTMLLSEDRPVTLAEVFERQPSAQALIATFLAVLELVRMQAVLLRQSNLFGEIVLRKHKLFDVVFSAEGAMAGADAEYR